MPPSVWRDGGGRGRWIAGGCAAGSLVGIEATNLDAKIAAASNVNPDDSGRASPVVIRIYELKKADTFQNTDFFSLYDKESATLGQDMNGREEVELQPEEYQDGEAKVAARYPVHRRHGGVPRHRSGTLARRLQAQSP